MKKPIFLFFLLIFSVFLLASCAKNQEQSQEEKGKDDFRRPDFGQPERQADVSGLVKAIIGNEVTIIKIERPQRNNGEDNDQKQTENTESTENSERPAQLNFSGGAEGRAPGMRGGFGGGNMDEDSRAEMLERIKEMSTGEEKVIIPIGIQMLKMGIGDAGNMPEAIEATLSDITADKMINIWLDESITDRKVASFVLINN